MSSESGPPPRATQKSSVGYCQEGELEGRPLALIRLANAAAQLPRHAEVLSQVNVVLHQQVEPIESLISPNTIMSTTCVPGCSMDVYAEHLRSHR